MKVKILVVDDESVNLDIVSDYLLDDNEHYEVLQASNGEEALQIIEAERDIDLVLTDWNMPIMDGLALVKRIRASETFKDLPVLMQTANTTPAELKQAFEAGAMDYIRKPIESVELLARVNSALALSQARKKTEELLLNILPKEVAEELKENGRVRPKPYEATILFTDFKGFSAITQDMEAETIVQELDKVFAAMDDITAQYRLEKIKTIGDAYMCAGGVPVPNETHAIDAINAALEIQAWMQRYKEAQISAGKPYFECRLGIHTGKVVAGVVGKSKFAYDIWGSTVNVASRMESCGEVGKVNISQATYALVKNVFKCHYRGKQPVKNLGEVDMYFVER